MTDLELYNLHTNPLLSTISFTDEENWLELRTKGIGGSDIGALMGINKYSSPLKIYKQKVENWKEDLSNNVYIKKGKDLEDLILDKYVAPSLAKEGYLVGKPNFMIINSDMPYLRANVDGIAYKPGQTHLENMIVEIKWVSEHAQVNWNGEDYCGVPPSYYAQVQLYMAVTGCLKATIFALFDSTWTVHEFVVPRDDLFILKMQTVAKKFYTYNMAMHIPPRLDADLDKDEVISTIKTTPAPSIPNDKMTKYVLKYKELSNLMKKAEAAEKKLKTEILDLYQQGYCPDDDKLSVKLSVVTTRRFNTNKFKEENATVYEQYCEDSSYSKFNIK